jgi:CHASE2 domain-containing sensor protein
VLLVGTSGRLANQSEDLFEAPATVQDALLRGDQPLWSGNAREVPGVLVQAVLIQSLNMRHWLTPLSQTICTAAAAALGVLLAALLERRQHRVIALGVIAAVACPLAWSLAIGPLWLVPLLLPLLALSAATFCRDD